MGTTLYIFGGVIVFIGTIALYFGNSGIVPKSISDWASFGTYVGGISGPLLSFVALIAVVNTLKIQQKTLDNDHQRQLADQNLRWLDALHQDMKEALDTPVFDNVTLRDALDIENKYNITEKKRLTLRLDNLMRILCQYCEAVDIYRNNISKFYDTKLYADRGARILDMIKPFHNYFENTIYTRIEFCDMHLRGEDKRATSEAMQRSSRK